MVPKAAIIYAAACVFVILFQLCLIAGAPWAHLTQGGGHSGSLPLYARAFAGLSALLITAMGLAIMSAAGFWPGWPVWTGWAAFGITCLSAIMNQITPSLAERLLWGPVTLIMLAMALIVMVSR